jgi:hypothetical protein
LLSALSRCLSPIIGHLSLVEQASLQSLQIH